MKNIARAWQNNTAATKNKLNMTSIQNKISKNHAQCDNDQKTTQNEKHKKHKTKIYEKHNQKIEKGKQPQTNNDNKNAK